MRTLGKLLFFLLIPFAIKAQNSSLNGTWVMDLSGASMTLELKQDGTGSLEGEIFKWTAKDGVMITEDEEGTAYYQYTLVNNTLTISDASGMVLSFIKKQSRSTPATTASPAKQSTTATSGTTKETTENKTASAASVKALIGHWKNDQAKLEIKSDGMMLINGVQYKYEVTTPGNITITGNDGSVSIPYSISGNKLTVTMNGQSAVYSKTSETSSNTTSPSAKGTTVGGATGKELVGKWCYMVNIYGSSGGTMKDECFTLNEDGSYTYKYESSSSNAYGSVASQDYDQGTWKVVGNQLHAYSTKGTQSVYTFEKKNHPKTGDPMIVIDGRAFVTYFNKTPWK